MSICASLLSSSSSCSSGKVSSVNGGGGGVTDARIKDSVVRRDAGTVDQSRLSRVDVLIST